MIYLFHGSDVERVRAKAFAWVAAARKKEPNLSYARLTREELSPAALEEASVAGALFVSRLLVLLDDPFPPARRAVDEDEDIDEKPSADSIDGELEALAASDNAIVILAPKLAAAKAKKIAAKAKQVYTFDVIAKRDEARGFNSALVNALAARSPELLWLEIARALRAGDAPEQLHGLLHWKARDILEKGNGAKWRPAEARALSMRLIALLMESRAKGLDLSRSLERFALSI